MFWGERKIGEETYLHLKLLSPNGGRARVHYIGFKVLEKITEALLLAKSILKGIMAVSYTHLTLPTIYSV